MKLITFFLAISIILESVLITLPLSLLIIIFASVTARRNDIFILAFFSGLFLDILKLGTIGLSSAYFVAVVMIILAYQKKFEINSLQFVFSIGLIGSLCYLLLTGVRDVTAQSLFSTFLITTSFFIFRKTNKKARSTGSTSSLRAGSTFRSARSGISGQASSG